MVHIYIEMGQGIVARGDFGVTTSTLHSCTFIAGCNPELGKSGAFHCPAGGFEKESYDDILRWQVTLLPTQIILVTGLTKGANDAVNARSHFEEEGCKVESRQGNGAAMKSNPFVVLMQNEIIAGNLGIAKEVQKQGPDRYVIGEGLNRFEYQLFGKDCTVQGDKFWKVK